MVNYYKNTIIMNKKQIGYLESMMENSRFNLKRLNDQKVSGVKFTAQDKRDVEYYFTKLQLVNEIFKTLPTLK
jgi:hypothetical protein